MTRKMGLRLLTKRDWTLMLAWRSSPIVYQGFYQQKEPLKWEEHINWIKSRNKDWRNFIIMYQDRPIGVVTIGQLDHWCPEIGWYIGEVSLWGQGVGREAAKLGLKYIKDYGREYCRTTVLKSNERCLSLLKSLGFEESGEAREGEIWVQVKL